MTAAIETPPCTSLQSLERKDTAVATWRRPSAKYSSR